MPEQNPGKPQDRGNKTTTTTMYSPNRKPRTLRRIVLSLCLALAFFANASAQDSAAKIEQFPLGQTLEITDLDRVFTFDIAAGTAVEVSISMEQLPQLDAHIFDPSSLRLLQTEAGDLPAGTAGIYNIRLTRPFQRSEVIAITSESGGRFGLRLTPRAQIKSSYSVFVSSPRPSTPRDAKLMEAARLMYEIAPVFTGKASVPEPPQLARRRTAIFRDAGDRYGLAIALELELKVGSTPETSLAAGLESRAILMDLGRVDEALAIDVCSMYQWLGDFQMSIFCDRERVALSRKIGNREYVAAISRSLGLAYHNLADEVRASEHITEALRIWRSLAAEAGPLTATAQTAEIQSLVDLAKIKQGISGLSDPVELYPRRTESDLREAISFYRQAKELNDRRGASYGGYIAWQMGAVTRDLGDLDGALKYLERAAALYKQSAATLAFIWLDLAKVHIARGDKAMARAILAPAVPLLRTRRASLHLAQVLIDADDPAAAIEINKQALAAGSGALEMHRVARIHGSLARAERSLGNFNNARNHILIAIETAESLRTRLTDDDVRSTYFASVQKFYDFYVDLLMQAHKAQPEKEYDRHALEVSEKARSRDLNDLLKLSGVDVRNGIDPGLLSQERTLRAQLNEKAFRQNRIRSQKHTKEDLDRAQREVADAADALASLEAEIKRRSPKYAAITQPVAITVRQIQELLDPGTVMLEYLLGDDKSYLWVVSAGSIQSVDLPPRDEIERRALRVYEAVTDRNKIIKGESARQQEKRVRSADAEYAAAAAALSETLLKPAAELITSKRIVVVPDGALHYISFAALPMPAGASGQVDAASSVAQRHEVITLPSASTLIELRRDRSPSRALSAVAVFADPLFSKTDTRARTIAGKGAKPAPPAERSFTRGDFDLALESVGITESGLSRLPFSAREAAAILKYSRGAGSLKKVDFDATKDSVFSSGLDRFRVLHFATHGLIDSRHPALSGMVLSLVDEKGNDLDGFLRLQDIYNLKLNAELVVLSACSTALGKQVRGEGLIGMTRGFMYAGAPRVVASLWKVDDVATSHLMSSFYRNMLKENMRPAAALRAAQLEMAKQTRWRSPYYWAPFVLQGDWR
jgi:CHAT domain-containing protein